MRNKIIVFVLCIMLLVPNVSYAAESGPRVSIDTDGTITITNEYNTRLEGSALRALGSNYTLIKDTVEKSYKLLVYNTAYIYGRGPITIIGDGPALTTYDVDIYNVDITNSTFSLDSQYHTQDAKTFSNCVVYVTSKDTYTEVDKTEVLEHAPEQPTEDELSTPAILNQEQTEFNVTVPTSIPVAVNSEGKVTCAGNAKIINNSYGPVCIKAFKVQPQNGWTLVDFTENLRKGHKFGENKFAVNLCGQFVPSSGLATIEGGMPIPGHSSIPFPYQFKISPVAEALTQTIASIVIVVDWDTVDSNPVVGEWSYVEDNGKAKLTSYNGSDVNIFVPANINGLPTLIPKVENVNGEPGDATSIFTRIPNLRSVTFEDGVQMETDLYDEDTAVMATFINCNTLQEVHNLPITNTYAFTFMNCNAMTEIPIFPEGVKTLADVIPSKATGEFTLPSTVTSFYQDIPCKDVTINLTNTQYEDSVEIYECEGIKYNIIDNIPNTDWEYTLTDTEALITSYKGTSMDDVVPATIEGKPTILNATSMHMITKEFTGPFVNRKDITSVKFEEGVKIKSDTGANMFRGCTSLKFVTGIPQIWNATNMFYGCTSLTTTPIFKEGLGYMDYTFYKCTKLISIGAIPNSVTNMKNTFENCYGSGLEVNITIPTGVENIDSIFKYAAEMSGTINIEGTITSATGAFKGTTQSFTINTPKVNKTIIDAAIQESDAANYITINYTE